MKNIIFVCLFFVWIANCQVFFGEDDGVSTLGPNSIAARNSFVSALGPCSFTTFNFENQPVGQTDLNLGEGTTLTSTGIYDGVSDTPIQPQALYGFPTSGVNFYQIYTDDSDVTFSFSTPQTAFGAYFTGLQPIFGPVVITFHDGTSQSFSINSPANNEGGSVFWGFISSTPFISVDIQDNFDAYGFDDVIIASCLCPGTESAGRFFIVTPLNNQIAGNGPSQCQIGVNYTEAIILCTECGGTLANVVFDDYFSSALSSLTSGFETCNDGTEIYKSFYINSYNGDTYGVPIDLTYPAITASSASALRGVLCQTEV